MNKENISVSLDLILKQLGSFGLYNLWNYALLLFPIYFAGLFGSVYVFEAPDLDYRCAVPICEGNLNDTWTEFAIPLKDGVPAKCLKYQVIDINGTCSIDNFDIADKVACNSYVYSEAYSVVKDFDLACQDWKRTLIGTLHNSGLFISLPLTGIVSDTYGRKFALSIASLMNGVFGLLRSFSTNYVMLVIFEFLEAACGAGAYSTAFVLAMELVRPKGRVLGNTLINTVFVFGLMSLSGLSWYLQDWRKLLRIIYTPAILVFSYIWIMNESARWLISKGRTDEAVVILKKAAKMNKVEISEELLQPLHNQELPQENVEKEKKPSVFVQVIRSRIIRTRVAVCSFMWITCTFVYYGLSINSVSLAGSKHLNFVLVAFVEIPANFLCLFLLDRYGRKRPLITAYIISAALCIGLSFLPKDQKWWSLIFYLSGKFSITVAYSSVYIYVSEVFPTSVRQSFLSICSSIGRVGSTLAPMTPLLALYYHNLPALFFGSLALIASCLVFILPETINVPLPNTVEEAEMLSAQKKDKVRA